MTINLKKQDKDAHISFLDDHPQYNGIYKDEDTMKIIEISQLDQNDYKFYYLEENQIRREIHSFRWIFHSTLDENIFKVREPSYFLAKTYFTIFQLFLFLRSPTTCDLFRFPRLCFKVRILTYFKECGVFWWNEGKKMLKNHLPSWKQWKNFVWLIIL